MPFPAVPGLIPRRPRGWHVAALAAFALAAVQAFAQAPAPAPTAPLPGQPVAGAAAPSASQPARAASKPASARGARRITTPLWVELSPAEQQSLAPLAGTWNTLSTTQKRKWQALAENFPKWPAEEQAKLHSRMTEWAALTPQQRTRARLNFGTAKQLSPDEKRAKWEAYQALPPEEKRKLAASAASAAKPPVTAAAIQPVPQDKLAKVPKPRSPASRPAAASPRSPASAPAAPASAVAPRAAAAASAPGPAR